MAIEKYVGATAVLSVDPAGGASFSQVLGVIVNKLPAQRKENVDVTAIDDTTGDSRQGIEEPGEFSFDIFWDPDDTVHGSLQTLYGSGDSAAWKLVLTDGSSTLTITWSGHLVELDRQPVNKSSGLVARIRGFKRGALTEAVT